MTARPLFEPTALESFAPPAPALRSYLTLNVCPMNVAQGSLEEARYYLILADELGYIDNAALLAHAEEISRLLERYIERIRFR